MAFKLIELETILRNLIQKCDLEALAIVSTKGQMVCSLIPQTITEKAFSAMAASLQSVANRVTRELDAGNPEIMIIDGAEKTIIIMGIGRAVLIGTAPIDSGIALIRFELSNATEAIRKVLFE
ncbi:MAG: roadblock/LC7 domain-containing protein [Candidatus Thorarchaeota archaeon]